MTFTVTFRRAMSEFEKIKRSYSKRGELFEDADFPATQTSVFYHQKPPFQFSWKRPKELCLDPVFIQDGTLQYDITPGKLGDHWFVSALGCLSTTKGLFYRVVPADQIFSSETDNSLDSDYVGVFRFRLWWCGEWQEVLVDDRLPTVNGKLVFVHSQHSNQFWAALLEKAYAKLHGSYEALKYACSQDGLADLMGGIIENFNIRQDPTSCLKVLGRLLKTTTVTTSIVQQQIKSRNQPEKLANGILLGTNYRVLGIDKVETLNGDQTQLVKLRNPLPTLSEYMGSWSKDSLEWEKILPEDNERLNHKNSNEGEFWMTYQDFVKTFTCVEAVHLDAETSKDEPTLRSKISWQMKVWHGQWQRGVSAGGCRNNLDSFHINPQFQIVLPEAEEVLISLSQHSILEPKVIGFAVFPMSKSLSTEIMEKTFFKKTKSIYSSAYSNSRQVSGRVHFEQGSYLILPTTFDPGEEANFTIRVISNKPLKLKLLDCNPAVLKPAIVKASPSIDTKINSYEGVFLQLSDEHKTTNAFELQDVLEVCLPNDYVKSCATLEVCRQVVLALDTTGNGRIRFSDYKNLMCSLKHWQVIFRNHTKGTTSVLRAEKLRDALFDVGFQVNTETLSLLAFRYMRKDGTLRFGDFVSCILHLSTSFRAFEKRDPLQNGYVKVNLKEWLGSSLQC
ncbi:calpain-C isoform X2 [Parasteatoda tepidariorum]|uniref:calpain-C isoform X2 n=1 Tax=Parasteatoda tepidariorum TaxID=114398 RepID=UPI000A2C03E9|nr:calpain-C isoform X2 [Parasteatoda tepidariorum]